MYRVACGAMEGIAPLAGGFRVRKTHPVHCMLGLQLAKGDLQMREWHKPTIEETESGMEVTSYLPSSDIESAALEDNTSQNQ
jgi:coenzyme PQQ precursor peptide PqqA